MLFLPFIHIFLKKKNCKEINKKILFLSFIHIFLKKKIIKKLINKYQSIISINLKINEHTVLTNYWCIIFFLSYANNKDVFDNLHIKFIQTQT